MSANDVRILEEMNLIPDEEGGNKYFVNGAMVGMADAGSWANKGVPSGNEVKNKGMEGIK